MVFDEVWLEIADDARGQIRAAEPDRWHDVSSGEELSFKLFVDTAIVTEPQPESYPAVVHIYGRTEETTWLLSAQTFHVLRPE